jgi:uncharacterized protein YbaR (Trm112 family)
VLLALVDLLRCPAHDEESSLVLSVEAWAGPRVAEGVLGCPICHARYRIHRGAVEFAPAAEIVRPAGAPVDPMRLAAQLSLTEPGGIILLTGRYAEVHRELTEFVDTTVILADVPPTSSPVAVRVQVADRLPFVDRALRGAAIDEPRVNDSFLTEIARCLQNNGRLVAPASTRLPARIRVMAQDDRELVGEAMALSQPVELRRAGPPSSM